LDTRTRGWTARLTHRQEEGSGGFTDKKQDGQTVSRMVLRTEGWTDSQQDGLTDLRMD
jgi:hypothetical protein